MRQYGPDIYRPDTEMYHCHQSVIVPSDIKNIPIVSDKVNRIKSRFYIPKITPVSRICLIEPIIQRLGCPGMPFTKLMNCSLRNDYHFTTNFSFSQILLKFKQLFLISRTYFAFIGILC
jgi:hypothetical protein